MNHPGNNLLKTRKVWIAWSRFYLSPLGQAPFTSIDIFEQRNKKENNHLLNLTISLGVYSLHGLV